GVVLIGGWKFFKKSFPPAPHLQKLLICYTDKVRADRSIWTYFLSVKIKNVQNKRSAQTLSSLFV
ncbi:MAG: hypothetical protein IJB20_01630, partial [Clostridia bacterium]|nr:hypothetical protein [Clostridia bacterium]